LQTWSRQNTTTICPGNICIKFDCSCRCTQHGIEMTSSGGGMPHACSPRGGMGESCHMTLRNGGSMEGSHCMTLRGVVGGGGGSRGTACLTPNSREQPCHAPLPRISNPRTPVITTQPPRIRDSSNPRPPIMPPHFDIYQTAQTPDLKLSPTPTTTKPHDNSNPITQIISPQTPQIPNIEFGERGGGGGGCNKLVWGFVC